MQTQADAGIANPCLEVDQFERRYLEQREMGEGQRAYGAGDDQGGTSECGVRARRGRLPFATPVEESPDLGSPSGTVEWRRQT
jgi:hypothetical protein